MFVGFNRADRLAEVEDTLATPIRWNVAMADRESPSKMRSSVFGQLLGDDEMLGSRSGRSAIVMTVPLAFGNGTSRTEDGRSAIASNLEETASGAWDEDYRRLAMSLIEAGHADAVIRLGHEFNGTWFPWSSRGNEPAYVAAFRHVHDVFATESDEFRFEWNAARVGFAELAPDAYPGDEYVDIIGLDVYFKPGNGASSMNDDVWERDYAPVLEAHRDFAIDKAKPVAFSEWGNEGVDEPEFVERMHRWFGDLPTSGAGRLLYHAYFNAPRDIYNLDDHPESKDRFVELFGGA